jgi:DNA-binding protein HU-beta
LTITNFCLKLGIRNPEKIIIMRKADLVNQISDKTGIPKVDVLVTLETMFKEIKESLAKGENIYVRGFGSFITKKRAAKIGRNIKKNIAVHIPEHYIPAFKPSKEFVAEVKKINTV